MSEAMSDQEYIERLEARVRELEADPRMALTHDDLAAIAGVIAKTGLFLSDTHVRVDVALAAVDAEGRQA